MPGPHSISTHEPSRSPCLWICPCPSRHNEPGRTACDTVPWHGGGEVHFNHVFVGPGAAAGLPASARAKGDSMAMPVGAVRWLAAVLAAMIVAGAASQATAQRTSGTTAGSLAADDPSKDIDRSSCVLMLRRGMRYTGSGSSSVLASGLADLPALTTAMTTTGLIDPAAKAALGLGPREWPKVVRIE